MAERSLLIEGGGDERSGRGIAQRGRGNIGSGYGMGACQEKAVWKVSITVIGKPINELAKPPGQRPA
jgi:hypothetical protein